MNFYSFDASLFRVRYVLVILLFAVAACHSEMPVQEMSVMPEMQKAPQTVTDSVEAYHEIALSPFHGSDSFVYFDSIMHLSDSTVQTLDTNWHDSSVMDTVTTVYWGKSSMTKIKNEFMSRDMLFSVIVTDDNLQLRNGIGLGDSTHVVFKAFDLEYGPQKTYSYIQLEAGEATSFLIIDFTNNVVSRITYYPYTG